MSVFTTSSYTSLPASSDTAVHVCKGDHWKIGAATWIVSSIDVHYASGRPFFVVLLDRLSARDTPARGERLAIEPDEMQAKNGFRLVARKGVVFS
jgi:hypothetical protein